MNCDILRGVTDTIKFDPQEVINLIGEGDFGYMFSKFGLEMCFYFF